MKILIVDDNKDNRVLLETVLTARGYIVESAVNGKQALEVAARFCPDMIISDILMPEMDGFQFCRECKKDGSLRKIPFVFYTATYTAKEDEEFALSLGAEMFLVKPLEPDEFLEKINGVIREYKKGALVTPQVPIKEEKVYLAEYNKHLVSKLEEKLLDLAREVTQRKKAEERLQEQTKALEQKNIALSEVLGQVELEKKKIKDNVITNAENLLLPIIQKLRLKGESRKYVQLLRKNLQELTSSFGAKLTEKRANLTTREIEICNMIKNGLTNKEIARLLNISLGTTEKHRNNIRKKLDIVNKDINLSSFLSTL